MKLEIGIRVSAPAVSKEYAVGKISNILTNVVIVEAGVKHYVVTKKVLREQGYIEEDTTSGGIDAWMKKSFFIHKASPFDMLLSGN